MLACFFNLQLWGLAGAKNVFWIPLLLFTHQAYLHPHQLRWRWQQSDRHLHSHRHRLHTIAEQRWACCRWRRWWKPSHMLCLQKWQNGGKLDHHTNRATYLSLWGILFHSPCLGKHQPLIIPSNLKIWKTFITIRICYIWNCNLWIALAMMTA